MKVYQQYLLLLMGGGANAHTNTRNAKSGAAL